MIVHLMTPSWQTAETDSEYKKVSVSVFIYGAWRDFLAVGGSRGTGSVWCCRDIIWEELFIDALTAVCLQIALERGSVRGPSFAKVVEDGIQRGE